MCPTERRPEEGGSHPGTPARTPPAAGEGPERDRARRSRDLRGLPRPHPPRRRAALQAFCAGADLGGGAGRRPALPDRRATPTYGPRRSAPTASAVGRARAGTPPPREGAGLDGAGRGPRLPIGAARAGAAPRPAGHRPRGPGPADARRQLAGWEVSALPAPSPPSLRPPPPGCPRAGAAGRAGPSRGAAGLGGAGSAAARGRRPGPISRAPVDARGRACTRVRLQRGRVLFGSLESGPAGRRHRSRCWLGLAPGWSAADPPVWRGRRRGLMLRTEAAAGVPASYSGRCSCHPGRSVPVAMIPAFSPCGGQNGDWCSEAAALGGSASLSGRP